VSEESLIKVDVGKLAEPATALVEKISNAVGALYEPTRIRRRARAEGEAEVYAAEAEGKAALIRARTDIELTDLNRRALTRFLAEETKKQVNMESITGKALGQLEEGAEPQNMDDDWISHFFDSSRHVSNEEMQDIWAKLLAGEANKPGSVSRRTVSLLATISPGDAEMFTKFCTFCGYFGGQITPFIFELQGEESLIYAKHGINFDSLMHLDSSGLVRFDGIGGFSRGPFGSNTIVLYYGQPTRLNFSKDEGNDLPLGHVLLTEPGIELANISGAKRDPDFLAYLHERWRDKGFSPSIDIEWRPQL
jgi:hypothetical protein